MDWRRPSAALCLTLAAALSARAQMVRVATKASKPAATQEQSPAEVVVGAVEPAETSDVPVGKDETAPSRDSPEPDPAETEAPAKAAPSEKTSSREKKEAAPLTPRAAAQDRALRRADEAAARLRQSLARPDSDAPAPAAARSQETAVRSTAADVALAAQTGFGPSIREFGYKVGRGPGGAPVVRTADGRPAAPDEVARLGAALKAEPEALMRRPDFFAVLPRADFRELKTDYSARPAWRGTVFKDIGMTPENRDFRWSASCSSLTGGCNPAGGETPYRAGEFVPPENLKTALAAARAASPDEGDDSELTGYTDEERQEAAAADAAARKMSGAKRTTLAGLLQGLGEWVRASSPGGAAEAEAPAGAAVYGEGKPGTAVRAGVRPAAGPAPERAVPPPPEAPKTRRPGALGFAAGLAAAFFVLRRLRRSV